MLHPIQPCIGGRQSPEKPVARVRVPSQKSKNVALRLVPSHGHAGRVRSGSRAVPSGASKDQAISSGELANAGSTQVNDPPRLLTAGQYSFLMITESVGQRSRQSQQNVHSSSFAATTDTVPSWSIAKILTGQASTHSRQPAGHCPWS